MELDCQQSGECLQEFLLPLPCKNHLHACHQRVGILPIVARGIWFVHASPLCQGRNNACVPLGRKIVFLFPEPPTLTTHTHTEDGLVRVWKDLELAGRQEVVAGWCAAPELNKRSTDRSGLLCGWFSRLGQLVSALPRSLLCPLSSQEAFFPPLSLFLL